MELDQSAARRPGETILPMINVVFLLLIFFLISARLTPPEPFPVAPPVAAAEAPAESAFTLYLGADGGIGYRDRTGIDAPVAALAADLGAHCTPACADGARPTLSVRADAAAPAAALARLLPRLGGLGFAQVDLVVAGQ